MLWAAAAALPEMVADKQVPVALVAAGAVQDLQIRADEIPALGLRVKGMLVAQEQLI